MRTKTRKYGQVLDEHWLQRLHSHAPAIWRDKPVLLLRAVNPIGAWTADPRIKTYSWKRPVARPEARPSAGSAPNG